MNERNLQDRIRLAISQSRLATMFRNNVGMARLKDGGRMPYGLCKGSSDLIGWRTVKITPDMIGKDIAVFTAIEIKTKRGIVSDAQRNFIERVMLAGGIAGVARSEDEAVKLLREGV